MGRINWGRVLLGGIAAGIVINVSEFILNAIVLREENEAMQASLEREPSIAVWVVYGFLVGIAAVWVYAAIRTRFGPGAATAARAGVAVWFLAYLLSSLAMLNIGLFPANLLALGLVWGLVEVLIAAMVGGWLYREA